MSGFKIFDNDVDSSRRCAQIVNLSLKILDSYNIDNDSLNVRFRRVGDAHNLEWWFLRRGH